MSKLAPAAPPRLYSLDLVKPICLSWQFIKVQLFTYLSFTFLLVLDWKIPIYILPVLYHVQTNIDRDLSHIMNWSELIWIDLDQIVKPYVSVWVYQVHVSSITSLWLELKLNCRTLIKCWQLFILWLSRLFYAKF